MLVRPKIGGFCHASVTKGLLLLNGSASLLHIFLASSSVKRLIPNYEWIEVIRHLKVLNVLGSSLYFSNARDLLCGSFLLYTYRIIERQYGSKKFASYLFACTVMTVTIQLCIVYVMKHFGHPFGDPPSGLYGVAFAGLVQYFFDIPSVDSITFLGIPVSGKILSYSIALQMLLGSRESLLAGACGMFAGFVYKFNIAYVRSWLKLPTSITNACLRIFSSLFGDDEQPKPSPMGATLEIQEQQQMEWYEQQVWRRAMATNFNNPRTRSQTGQGYAEVMIPQAVGLREWLMGGNHGDIPNNDWPTMMNHNHTESVQQATVEVSEEQVQTLVEMGFSRQDVLRALSVTNNDVNRATSFLLSNS